MCGRGRNQLIRSHPPPPCADLFHIHSYRHSLIHTYTCVVIHARTHILIDIRPPIPHRFTLTQTHVNICIDSGDRDGSDVGEFREL